MLRYERVDVCAECQDCKSGGKTCESIRCEMRKYSGVRFTADGFDCALPVSIDSHTRCSFGCQYCFSDNLLSHREESGRPVGQTSLRSIERIFSGAPGKKADLIRSALKYDRRNKDGYPCPIQLGALTDPCDNIERNQGWLLDFIKLAIRYRQPVRISTKGRIFQEKEYLDAVAKAPELFWVTFSTITPDDEIIKKIDVRAPNATERIRTMAMLSSVGVKTALRFRPVLPGISDRTRNYPHAYRTLIERAAEAGAVAISTEVAFAPGTPDVHVRKRWDKLSKIAGMDLLAVYGNFGKRQACTRPAYTWTEGIMHAITETAHAHGMTVGVSDPVWKQLGETGCCCGMLPDDPVFGNWQRESATNQLLKARDTGCEMYADDIVPAWAHILPWDEMCNPGVGPLSQYKRRHLTWADELKRTWNSVERERGPLNYFQGAMIPTRRDNAGDLVYKYIGLEREHKSSQWSV